MYDNKSLSFFAEYKLQIIDILNCLECALFDLSYRADFDGLWKDVRHLASIRY